MLNDLANFENRSDLDAKEKTALRFAERMTLDSNNVDEALWAQLREHFDEGEVVELASAIGLFNYFNKFNNALQMEPTK
ncbi:MAG: carboxymuconolactone decarboxylase family protein [Terriglobales bacterium]